MGKTLNREQLDFLEIRSKIDHYLEKYHKYPIAYFSNLEIEDVSNILFYEIYEKKNFINLEKNYWGYINSWIKNSYINLVIKYYTGPPYFVDKEIAALGKIRQCKLNTGDFDCHCCLFGRCKTYSNWKKENDFFPLVEKEYKREAFNLKDFHLFILRNLREKDIIYYRYLFIKNMNPSKAMSEIRKEIKNPVSLRQLYNKKEKMEKFAKNIYPLFIREIDKRCF